MRDLLKLDISKGDNGFLKLIPLPINGIQAEIRLSSTPEQMRTLCILVPEIKSILFNFDKLYRDFLSGTATTYSKVQEVLIRFDTPNIHGAQINEDFLLDLTEELHGRLARIEALIPEQTLVLKNNPNVDLIDLYDEEVTEERKASLKSELDKIEGIPEKIKFLEIKKLIYLQNISGSALAASGTIITGGFPNGPLLFDRYIEFEIRRLKLEAKGPVVTIDTLIKPELINTRLVQVEEKLKGRVTKWRMGNDKIGCAAFCELLFENRYFLNNITKRKGPTQFALSQYGLDITVQIGSGKKADRNKLKPLLKHCFS